MMEVIVANIMSQVVVTKKIVISIIIIIIVIVIIEKDCDKINSVVI